MAIVGPACAKEPTRSPYVGFWEMSFDEDGSPRDTMEIRSDGTIVARGTSCETADVIPYHLHGDYLYSTIEVPEKGPIAAVFRILEDGRLSLTSPDTLNNAYYRRLPADPCAAAKRVDREAT